MVWSIPMPTVSAGVAAKSLPAPFRAEGATALLTGSLRVWNRVQMRLRGQYRGAISQLNLNADYPLARTVAGRVLQPLAGAPRRPFDLASPCRSVGSEWGWTLVFAHQPYALGSYVTYWRRVPPPCSPPGPCESSSDGGPPASPSVIGLRQRPSWRAARARLPHLGQCLQARALLHLRREWYL